MKDLSGLTLNDITILVINHRTLDLTERCVTSLLLHYPHVGVILTDNGSQDESTAYIQALGAKYTNIQPILHPKNLHHGPALHYAIQAAASRFVFTLDSDCQVLQGGFLETMLQVFMDPQVYAVGRLVQMNRFGYELKRSIPGALPYIHPFAMLLDRHKYLDLKPFFHHGSPGLENMRSAVRAGWRLQHFPLEGSIYHQGRGTCSRYGYALGWRHVLEHFLYRATTLTK